MREPPSTSLPGDVVGPPDSEVSVLASFCSKKQCYALLPLRAWGTGAAQAGVGAGTTATLLAEKKEVQS